MALSPWPTSPVALASATTILKQVLSGNLTDARVQQLGSTASAVVEDYAPSAPTAVRDQALEMYAGYLAQARTGPVTKIDAGKIMLERMTNHAGAFRLCGAAGLLGHWRIRRAGTV